MSGAFSTAWSVAKNDSNDLDTAILEQAARECQRLAIEHSDDDYGADPCILHGGDGDWCWAAALYVNEDGSYCKSGAGLGDCDCVSCEETKQFEHRRRDLQQGSGLADLFGGLGDKETRKSMAYMDRDWSVAKNDEDEWDPEEVEWNDCLGCGYLTEQPDRWCSVQCEIEHGRNKDRKTMKKSMTYMDKGKRGLWDNVHAKKKRGEKAAKPGDKGYPDKKNWDKLTNKSYECGCNVCTTVHGILEKKEKTCSKMPFTHMNVY